MNSPVLRIALIVGAAWMVYVVTSRVKRSKIQIEDSVFWVVLAVIILLNALFPQVAYFFSGLLGIASPSNFVFLLVSAILLFKEFSNSTQISVLKHKVDQLSQELALEDKARRDHAAAHGNKHEQERETRD